MAPNSSPEEVVWYKRPIFWKRVVYVIILGVHIAAYAMESYFIESIGIQALVFTEYKWYLYEKAKEVEEIKKDTLKKLNLIRDNEEGGDGVYAKIVDVVKHEVEESEMKIKNLVQNMIEKEVSRVLGELGVSPNDIAKAIQADKQRHSTQIQKKEYFWENGNMPEGDD